ncbi:M1 family metallopeptidase [Acidomonas methanolica]|nr:M1 family metallopeptidase [Acidomonas methanolica]MBU2654178.1 M1 family metallopeptidase [Acidomonas methanolica]GBQ46347.1 peptidase [Acidomonas methanolica]
MGAQMRSYLLVLAALWPAAVSAGEPPAPDQTSPPVAREVFGALALPGPVNAYRSGSGKPGPNYWQNRADYVIHARIDTRAKTLQGEETITYTNNSPDTLNELWVQLDQNIYRADARGALSNPERHPHFTDGIVLDGVGLTGKGPETVVSPLVSDTRMRIVLPAPLPHGGVARLHVRWHYAIPGAWGGRTAVTQTRDGEIYEIAQWYPRMAVYDDLRGWDTLPYLGQEFYLDYGNFDYAVTVPWNFTVVGSGALLNPQEVLTPVERERLAAAAKSETRVMIRTAAEAHEPSSHLARSGEKTWHFHMTNTRDVAFAASDAFVWDAARLDLPPLAPAPGMKPQPRLAMSAYAAEGAGPKGWDRSTEYVKHAIEYFSSQWYPYPWPDAVNLGGHGAGMEYPGIVFDGWQDHGAELFWITTHELGHGWFPMIVGSNERRHAFMDEGFNTFIDAYASQHFNHGEFAPKQDAEFAPQTGDPAADILPVLTDPAAPTLMLPSELVPEKYRHPVTYFKSAYGLMLLREQILGPERFDAAFRAYIRDWAFHHPAPSDFFRFMSSAAGEDLTWFWRGWYLENWWPSYAIDGVSAADGAVTVRNRGKLPLPVLLRVRFADGATAERRVPTEAWYLHDRVTVSFPGHAPLSGAELDPAHVLPMPDRSGDVWSGK